MSFSIIKDTQYIGNGGELTAQEEIRVQEIQALSDTASAEALGKQSGSVVKVSPGGGGGGTWGSITGTLADQTDLQNALDAKQNSGSYLTSSNISDTYTGNGGTNTAIPHNLGLIPKYVSIWAVGADTEFKLYGITPDIWRCSGWGDTTVTAADNTNFYVSDVVNTNDQVYIWFAIG